MKKFLIRLLACAAAAACTLSLTACNSENKAESENLSSSSGVSSAVSSSSVESAAGSSAVSSQASGGVNANGKYTTVEDFANSDLIQRQLETMRSNLGDKGEIDITGEGNKLIYTFVYNDVADSDVEAMSAALSAALDQAANTYETVAAALRDAAEVDDPVVVVTYKTQNGTELCSKEFTPVE